jgi:hypothetical protein
MPTQKPLRELVPDLLQHVRRHKEYLEYNNRLMLVHEGQLRNEIEDSMRAELSPAAYAKAIKRVPSINLLVRIIDKLSRVYSEPVLRSTDRPSDMELLDYYVDEACINERMAAANRMLNLHKCVALEPYARNGKPHLRVIPAHQFLVFSDDPTDPLCPTVFIKIMAKEWKNVPFTDRDGRKTDRNETREVDIFYVYSDDEFLVLDSDGTVRDDKMSALGNGEGVNPLGTLPAVYVNRSDFRLLPVPDTDTLDNTVLVPKLLADLNYAVQFQSHSILIATDLEVPANVPMAPDTIWALSSNSEDGSKQGRIDAVKPSVDIEKVLMLVQTTLAIWLESRNIKAGTFNQIQAANAASGIAKLIDEADATQDRKAQCGRFHDAEVELWALFVKLHKYWSETGEIDERKLFSEDCEVSIRFPDQKPIRSDKEVLEEIKLAMDAGIMTRRQALAIRYPYLTEKELDRWIEELDEERAANADQQRLEGADGQDPANGQGPGDPASGGSPDSGADKGADAGGPGGKGPGGKREQA